MVRIRRVNEKKIVLRPRSRRDRLGDVDPLLLVNRRKQIEPSQARAQRDRSRSHQQERAIAVCHANNTISSASE